MSEGWDERVEALLIAGKPWRAKEVLRGNIAGAGYDRALFRRYAELLAALGEEMEAGKYFWLAGAEEERARAAIGVYLARHHRSTGLQLYQDFPTAARVGSFEPYPEAVSRLLRERGLAEPPPRRRPDWVEPRSAPRWVVAGCVTTGILLLAVLVVGLIAIARWLTGLF